MKICLSRNPKFDSEQLGGSLKSPDTKVPRKCRKDEYEFDKLPESVFGPAKRRESAGKLVSGLEPYGNQVSGRAHLGKGLVCKVTGLNMFC